MRRRSVSLTRSAQVDLLELEAWIAGAGAPGAAVDYVNRVRAGLRRLGDLDGIGHVRDDLAPGLRQTNVEGALNVLFRIEGGRIRVYRVVDGARDLRRVAAQTAFGSQ